MLHFFACTEIIFASYLSISVCAIEVLSVPMKIFLLFWMSQWTVDKPGWTVDIDIGQAWMDSWRGQWTWTVYPSLDGHPNQTIQTMINQVNTLLPSLQTFLIKFLKSGTPCHLDGFQLSVESNLQLLNCFTTLYDWLKKTLRHLLNQWDAKLKLVTRFSALGACYMYLLQVLIGLFLYLHLSSLVRFWFYDTQLKTSLCYSI